jgi:hypothetical protein
MFRGRRVPVQTYLVWVGARPIAVDQAIAGALPPPTAEQNAFHVVQECKLRLPSRLRKMRPINDLSAHLRPRVFCEEFNFRVLNGHYFS